MAPAAAQPPPVRAAARLGARHGALRAVASLAAVLLYTRAAAHGAQSSELVLEFAPVSGSNGLNEFAELINMVDGMLGVSHGGATAKGKGKSVHAGEAQLDDLLAQQLAAALAGPTYAAGKVGGGSSPAFMMPAQEFNSLFPGMSALAATDPLLASLMGEFHGPLQGMLGHVSDGQFFETCSWDIKTHCKHTNHVLHCLGQQGNAIAPACKNEVGQSVPFLCSDEITLYCQASMLTQGVLPCLEARLAAPPLLGSTCMDAVLTTRQVVTKANTMSVSLKGKQGSPQQVVSDANVREQSFDKLITAGDAAAGGAGGAEGETVVTKGPVQRSAVVPSPGSPSNPFGPLFSSVETLRRGSGLQQTAAAQPLFLLAGAVLVFAYIAFASDLGSPARLLKRLAPSRAGGKASLTRLADRSEAPHFAV